jgi:hypothetical protein
MANVSPKVEVQVTGPRKYTLTDKKYTEAHPEYYEKYKDHPKLKAVLSLAAGRAHIACEAEQEMGILDRDVKATWPNNVELAKRRTLGRRKNMHPEELALWEAHRSPETGVPPADVVGSLDGGWIVEN